MDSRFKHDREEKQRAAPCAPQTERGKPPCRQASRFSCSPKETKPDAAATTNIKNDRTHLSNLPPRSNTPHTHVRDTRHHPIRNAHRIGRSPTLNRINQTCLQAQCASKAQQTPHRIPSTASHLKALRSYEEKTARAEALAVRSNHHGRF